MAVINVSSGVTSTGIMLDTHDSMFVSSGGTANSTTVYGGKMTVLAKGMANSTTVSSGGRMMIEGTGVANYTMVTINGEFYASSGGTMNHTTVNGLVAVLDSAGAANDTTVLYGGRFRVSKGTANSTTVNSGGEMEVSSGGTATSTTVNSGGKMEVSSGGTAAVIREDGGYIDVKSGAVATFVSNTMEDLVFSGTTASLHSGTTANNTQVKYSGKLYVCGGRASNTTVSLEGSIVVSGGAANGNTVNFDGRMYVSSGGTANRTTVNSGGSVDVRSGGTANSTTVTSGGSVAVRSGTVNSTTLYAGGSIALYDGVAKNTVVSSGAYFCIFNDGDIASNTTVCEGGTLRVSHGATVDTATLNAGYMTVARNGVAKDVLVNADGELIVQIGGVATGAKVDSRGTMIVSSGGTAMNTTIRSGGMARVYGPVFVSEFVVDGELQVMSGGVMSQGIGGLTMGDGGRLTIMDSATVCGTVVKNSASVVVEWKGSFAMAGISGGRVTASDGAILDSVFLNSGSLLEAASRAVIKDVCVSSGAVLTGVLRNATDLVFSGGTLDLNIAKFAMDDAYIVDAASFACIKAGTYGCTLTVSNKQENGTYKLIEGATGFNATVTVQNVVGGKLGTITVGGGPTEVLGGVFYDLKLSGNNLIVTVTGGAVPDPLFTGDLINERKNITSGMSALGVNVMSGGELYISSGGEASITTVSSGGLFKVCSKGDTEDTNVESGGTMFIYDDVMAKNVVVDGGVYVIESDGWAYQESKGKLVSSNTIVKNGGTVIVSGGGHCGGVIVSDGGHVIVESDGHLGSAFITSGDVTVKAGVESAGASLLDGGVMVVESGGTAGCTVSSGGVVEVESGAYLRALTVSTGGVVTGVLHDIFTVFRMYGGTLDLDIANAAPDGEYLIDDDANFDPNEDFNCTLTVSDMLTNGTYNLMEYAYEFDTKVITAESPLTVKSTSGATLGTLTVGQTAEINGVTYTLNLSNDNHLTVTVSGSTPPPTPPPTPEDKLFFSGDFNGDHFDTLAVQKDSTVTIYQNGEAWGLGLTLDPGWTVVGTGDFNGDNLDDFLRVNTEGYVVGEMSNGNGTFTPQVLNLKNAGWNILGTGDFNGNGTSDVLIANPTGASDTVGLLGYWESGVTWTLINGYSPEWECVSTGDFNGDGKCDMLWRNSFIGEGGLTYNAYCTWIMDNPVDWRMVSVANPKEWNFLCSGDFDGNGSHDIAMINDVGVVGIWGVTDGYLSSWSILSAVTNEWKLAGVADFNADGTDDIAWSNADTGLTGYWQINDKTLTTWQNIATLS